MIFAVILFTILLKAIASNSISLSLIPHEDPVYLGQEAVLRCRVDRLSMNSSFKILFMHDNKMISESCEVYIAEKYRIECDTHTNKSTHTYNLIIKSVSWEDRGKWSCILGANSTHLTLDIYAPAELKPIETSVSMPPPLNLLETEASRSAAVLPRSSIQMQQIGGRQDMEYRASNIGFGTRTNPFDLRPGFVLNLTCTTTCGYPLTNLSWTSANSNGSQTRLLTSKFEGKDDCISNTNGMISSMAQILIHCNHSSLIGLNQIKCTAFGPQYSDTKTNKYVFVLCQGGERPLAITRGEVIGIATGSGIALILVFVGCILIRRRNKDVLILPTYHIRGQRV